MVRKWALIYLTPVGSVLKCLGSREATMCGPVHYVKPFESTLSHGGAFQKRMNNSFSLRPSVYGALMSRSSIYAFFSIKMSTYLTSTMIKKASNWCRRPSLQKIAGLPGD